VIQKRLTLVKESADTLRNPLTNIAQNQKHIEVRAGKLQIMIKKVKITDVIGNPENPRIIKDYKYKSLVKSIKEFPKMLEIRPIVVNKDMMILGGNMRWKACIESGIKEIPVIIASDLTEKEQREFTIKDNVAFGEWDWDGLANEWNVEDLTDWGLDLPKFETIGDIEANGRMASTLDEKLDTYLNATIKQIVLYYEIQDYEAVLKFLDKVASENDLLDNSSVIKFLSEKYESK
jgi:hypothetical protein